MDFVYPLHASVKHLVFAKSENLLFLLNTADLSYGQKC